MPSETALTPGCDVLLLEDDAALRRRLAAHLRGLGAEVTGGDGFGEVTFTLERASRPGQVEYLGTDDAAPYRIFWRPANDLPAGEKFTLAATHNDLRGRVVSSQVPGLSVASSEVPAGIVGSKVPFITRQPVPVRPSPGQKVILAVEAGGTGPLEYQWLRNDEEVPGATASSLLFPAGEDTSGHYRAMVRNRAGTTLVLLKTSASPFRKDSGKSRT